jgi:hypothetical protein
MYDTVDYPQPTCDYLPDKCRGSHEADAVFVLRITRTVHHGFGLLLSSSTLQRRIALGVVDYDSCLAAPVGV